MENILVIISLILAFVLVVAVLLQKSEGGALGLGVSQDSFTSARTVGSFLTKFTSIVAALFKKIKEIDGFLIGGASKSSKKFIDIIKNYYR